MTVGIAGWVAKLLVGRRASRVAQIVGISFLENVLRLVHSDQLIDLSVLRAGVLREEDADNRIKEAEATSREAEAEAKRGEAQRIAMAVERDRIESRKAEIQLEEEQLRIAEKKGKMAVEEAKQALELARAKRIQAAEEVLVEKLTNVRMKGGGAGVDAPELMSLIKNMRNLSPSAQVDLDEVDAEGDAS